tara:strand:- start:184 stop:852 length:669 start_codon:yes stop_codon:yes gene_type:complete
MEAARSRRRISDYFVTTLSTPLLEGNGRKEWKEIATCVAMLQGAPNPSTGEVITSPFKPLFVCSSDVLFVNHHFNERYRASLIEALTGMVNLIGMCNTTNLLKVCLDDEYAVVLINHTSHERHSAQHMVNRARLAQYAVESDSAAEFSARCSPMMCCMCIEILCLFVHLTCRRRPFTQIFSNKYFQENVGETRRLLLDMTHSHLTSYEWMKGDAILYLMNSE